MTENELSPAEQGKVRAKIAELIDEVGREVAQELAQSFLADIPETMGRITDSAQQGNHTELQRAAHSYKSLAQFYGLEQVGNLAKELELAAEAQSNEQISPLVTDFLAANQQGIQALVNEFESGFQITLEPAK